MTSDFSGAVAQRLREARVKAGLSLQQLGDRIHASKGEIGKIETGKRRLTLDWTVRICNGLALDHDEFLRALQGGAGHPSSELGNSPDLPNVGFETQSLPKQDRRPPAVASGDLVWISRDLPVKGRLNSKGQLMLSEGGRANGYTHRPPQLAHDMKAFAVPAPADGSMSPMFKPGQMLMVSSIAPVQPGSGVLVILRKEGRAEIGELVDVSAKGVTMRTYSPKTKTVMIASALIEVIFRIVGAMDGTF